MDDKSKAMFDKFQELFISNLSNMNFMTDENLTIGQRSTVIMLAMQAMRDTLMDMQPAHSVVGG